MENDGRSNEKNLYEVSQHSLYPMVPIRVSVSGFGTCSSYASKFKIVLSIFMSIQEEEEKVTQTETLQEQKPRHVSTNLFI